MWRQPVTCSEFSPTDQHPIIQVSWHDAMAYTQWAGKRLPTEAEWEKAARGGLIGTKYPWGDTPPNGTQCNFADKNSDTIIRDKNADDGYKYTAPVGSFSANGYGLHGMAGNVYEWCLDELQVDFYSNSPRRNPIAGANSVPTMINRFTNNKLIDNEYSVRGGAFWDRGWEMRVADREAIKASGRWIIFSFRCVRDVVL